ncbi:MAG TPA: sigma-70 family RNA polymerase sigma factor [Candidatus Polarisedimenticolia bacterium]|nr:sigma-70 family RNA polymerase sigma factor [Candidatus Polarisedimenticolia bacterium]
MADRSEDVDLLERIRNDEPGAFEQFVARYEEAIYRFGLRVCGEREDARDVLQETLLKAFRSLKELRHPAALRSWLYRVASNACLMRRRKGKFEPAHELSLDDLAPRETGTPRPEIPDPASLPDEQLARGEIREMIRAAVEGLPRDHRIVLVLRDMEHLSTREVSEALELPETTVKMRLHRARLAVRQRLEAALAAPAPKEGGRA